MNFTGYLISPVASIGKQNKTQEPERFTENCIFSGFAELGATTMATIWNLWYEVTTKSKVFYQLMCGCHAR